MSAFMRVMLLVGAVATLLFVMRQVRKDRLQISDTIFWLVFSGFLVWMSLFPKIVVTLAHSIGFMSPSNFVYLILIFILIMNQFFMTMRMSTMAHQITRLTQHIALQNAKQPQTQEEQPPEWM